MRTAHRLAEDLERVGAAPVARLHGVDFQHFVDYLRDHLTSKDAFSKEQNREINRDIDAIADSDSPPMEDEPFDLVQDWVIEWTHANPVPIPHRKVPDLEH